MKEKRNKFNAQLKGKVAQRSHQRVQCKIAARTAADDQDGPWRHLPAPRTFPSRCRPRAFPARIQSGYFGRPDSGCHTRTDAQARRLGKLCITCLYEYLSSGFPVDT